jgi:hypothetical protein
MPSYPAYFNFAKAFSIKIGQSDPDLELQYTGMLSMVGMKSSRVTLTLFMLTKKETCKIPLDTICSVLNYSNSIELSIKYMKLLRQALIKVLG